MGRPGDYRGFFQLAPTAGWEPAGRLASGEDQDGGRYITNYLTWTSDSLRAFDAYSAFYVDLVLNDSTASKYGPGVYVDLDTVEIVNTLPAPYTHSRFSIFPYEKRFAIGSLSPISITGLVEYKIELISGLPGNAAQDNAEMWIVHAVKWSEGCGSSWCVLWDRAGCTIHDQPWGVEPIPGTFPWPQPPPAKCTDSKLVFLPVARNPEEPAR